MTNFDCNMMLGLLAIVTIMAIYCFVTDMLISTTVLEYKVTYADRYGVNLYIVEQYTLVGFLRIPLYKKWSVAKEYHAFASDNGGWMLPARYATKAEALQYIENNKYKIGKRMYK
jgi:hypothetical protein